MIPLVTCIFIKNGKVLMEKRPEEDNIDPSEYHFPAGHINKKESLEDAVVREMKEELGVDMKDFEYLRKIPYRSEGGDFIVYYFICINWEGKIKSKSGTGKLFWFGDGDRDKFSFDKDRRITKEVLDKFA